MVPLIDHRSIGKMIEEEVVEEENDKIEGEVEVVELEHLVDRQKAVADEHRQNEEYLFQTFLLK